jgi:hypothetical protein
MADILPKAGKDERLLKPVMKGEKGKDQMGEMSRERETQVERSH